tara:strand:- start:1657 stop:2199 length:543 start_codon:yes stop_codon:yes gene_type:complete
MNVVKMPIEGLLIITPTVFNDSRGYFFESWSENLLQKNNIELKFVQDNESLSHKGVLRGLHFQNPPYEQGKLVRVIKGAVLDVAVDIRKLSPTYGKYCSVKLSSKNKKIFWIPPGFAHGFLTLENDTIFSYKCTSLYNKSSEEALLWNDADLNIDWGIDIPIVSEKDNLAGNFKDFKTKF